MTLTINGQSRATDQPNVLDLLTSLNIHPKTVVVEYNGEILPRDRYAIQQLSEKDTMEIVQMMAGG